jgi:hypothetical protein
MKQAILTSVALIAIGTAWSSAYAQPVPTSAFAPTQGQSAYLPSAKSIATTNDNNNAQAAAVSGQFANPTPRQDRCPSQWQSERWVREFLEQR